MISRVFHVKPLFFALSLLLSVISFGQHFSSSRIEVKPLPPLPPVQQAVLQSFSSSPVTASLNPEVKDWYYWTNYLRLRPKAMWDSIVEPVLKVYPQLNTGYAKSLKKDLYNTPVLPPMVPSGMLLKLSQSHANDLAKSGRPSHSSSNGTSFQDRMTKAGVLKCAGENISMGDDNVVLSLVFLLIDEGIPDLGHRKSLLNPAYTELGVGSAKMANNSRMVVQDFACPQVMAK